MVGGNGPNVTWRLAARFADELNLDGMSPDEVREALPVIRSRCEEIGRDPATLRISVHLWWGDLETTDDRVGFLSAYREAGVDRVMGLFRETATDPGSLEAIRRDAVAAGAELGLAPAR
jgi:alkanesulfonate monooxygenase SsuD/methylene tetrahydromethanopterin reductase-like flavin-dependent oxidoreductase (luciferase family)